MSDIKWIKLTVDVFDDEKFDIIKKYPNRNDIQLVWIKLLCLAGKCNECGLLVIASEIPYTDEMLADRFNMDMDTIKEAMEVFQKLRMIEVVDNAYMVSNWMKYQSVDKLVEKKNQDRERQRKYREKQREKILAYESKEKSNFSSTNSTEKSNFSSIKSTEKGNIPSIKSTENVKKKSFDDRTNVENLDYVIENKLHDNINCIVGHEKLLNALYEWMKYKDARKPKTNNHYASIQAFKSLITKLVTAMNEYGEDELVECINNSMANNYSGIIFNMLGKNQQGKKPKFDAEAWASQ